MLSILMVIDESVDVDVDVDNVVGTAQPNMGRTESERISKRYIVFRVYFNGGAGSDSTICK